LYAVIDVVLMMLAPRFMCASAYFVTAKYCARVSAAHEGPIDGWLDEEDAG
jgi:hypothetical protein